MPTVVVMGSCLANLPCLFLMSDYKWERPSCAAILRSDHFVDKFLDRNGYLPPQDELFARIQWKPGLEKEGSRWLREAFRETVGHMEIPLEQPGLFEILETRPVDVVVMDNLHDIHTLLLHNRPADGDHAYSLPFSLSRCANERELAEQFYYGPPQDPESAVRNWTRIIRYVQEIQPRARIIFYCAHHCTMSDIPDRYERARAFSTLMLSSAPELGITIIPPFELPPELTRMPEDRDHFDMRVYRSMAGQIFAAYHGLGS